MGSDSDYCSNESDTQQKIQKPGKKEVFKGKLIETVAKKSAADVAVFITGKNKIRLELRNVSKVGYKSGVLKDKLLAARALNKGQGFGDIEEPDWEPEVFRVLLDFLESDVLKIHGVVDYVQLLKLCVAYELPKLTSQVSPILKQNLTLDNCVEIYKLAASKDIDDLRVASYQFFLRLGNTFLEHQSFLSLDCITLSILIASDDFNIVELTLFNRLKEWVVKQCKRLNYPPDRKELFGRVAGLLFQHVRYPQMTPKEFRNNVLNSGLLNQAEIEAVNLRHRTHPGLWYMLPSCPFIDRQRMAKLQFAVPLYNNVQIGFRKIHGESGTIKESVRFMVSHDIYLTSIGFFGPAKSSHSGNGSQATSYSIRILVEGDYSKYYCRCPSQNATIQTRENFSIDLNQPLRIQRLEPYKLTVWIDGEVTQFGVFPLPQAIVLIQDRGELITFHFCDADTDPQPILETSGAPSSTTPAIIQQPFLARQYKQEPRMSGVIRCISFVLKDR